VGLIKKSSSPFLYFLTLDRSRFDRIPHPGFNLTEIKIRQRLCKIGENDLNIV